MSKIKWNWVLCVLLPGAVGVDAWAQTDVIKELQEINQRRAVLEAQLKEAEVQKKLMDLQTQMGLMDTGKKGAASPKGNAAVNLISTGNSTPVSNLSANLNTPPSQGMEFERAIPTVAYVEGLKGRLEAVLVYRGNARQRVKLGDVVNGAMVEKISLNEVVLKDVKSKATIQLQFSTTAIAREPAGLLSQAGNVGIPAGSPAGPVAPLPNFMR